MCCSIINSKIIETAGHSTETIIQVHDYNHTANICQVHIGARLYAGLQEKIEIL